MVSRPVVFSCGAVAEDASLTAIICISHRSGSVLDVQMHSNDKQYPFKIIENISRMSN